MIFFRHILILKFLQNAGFNLSIFSPQTCLKIRNRAGYSSFLNTPDPKKSSRSKTCILKKLGYISFVAAYLAFFNAYATTIDGKYYRNFWYPTYKIQRLNYCSADGKRSGLPVANQYCKLMGYETADQEIIQYNVGRSNYIMSTLKCNGIGCNGFKLIRCVSTTKHNPPPNYYYRSQKFVYPRFDKYRVDWCYENGKGCGQKAAYSFCRRMGYTKAQTYKQQAVGETRAIGNQRLCMGKQCKGFEYIVCFR